MEGSRRNRKRTRRSLESSIELTKKEYPPQPLKKEKENPVLPIKKEKDFPLPVKKDATSSSVKKLSSQPVKKEIAPQPLKKPNSTSPIKKVTPHQSSRKGIPQSLKRNLMMQHEEDEDIETIDLTAKQIMPVSNHFSSFNGDFNSQMKKLKKGPDADIGDVGRRNQPHRAARFTESYSAPVENILLSDEEVKSRRKSGSSSSSSSSEDSDSDCEIIPQSPKKPLTAEEQADWERRLHELQKELSDEEVKLALLRKLKHSQEHKEEKKEAPAPQPLPPHITSLNKARQLKDITITTTTVDTSPTKKLLVNNSKRIHRPNLQDMKKPLPSAVRNEGPVNLAVTNEKPIITIQPITTETKPSPQVSSSTNTLTVKNITNLKTAPQPQPTPPPPPSTPTSASNTNNHQEKVVQEKVNKEMTAQQAAMAKVILRKQIEKTLLQIPSPKSLTPDLHFVPNANPLEFIYYLGLDVVVDFLTNTKKPPFCVEPFSCSECKTDFTPTWRTVKKHKSSRKQCVICNACFCYSAKHTLKKEHTARLKAALTKAAQQEKELERLTSSSNSNIASLTNIAPNYSLASSSLSLSENTTLSTSSPLIYNKATLSSSRTTSTPPQQTPNFFLGNPNVFNLAAFAKLPHQLQALIQAQAQSFMAANLSLPSHMIPFATPFIPSYPFHLQNKATSSQSDLQRQYLLDMIPSKRQN